MTNKEKEDRVREYFELIKKNLPHNSIIDNILFSMNDMVQIRYINQSGKLNRMVVDFSEILSTLRDINLGNILN